MVAKRRFRDGMRAAPVEEYANTAPGGDNDGQKHGLLDLLWPEIRRIASVLPTLARLCSLGRVLGRKTARQAPGLDKDVFV